MSKRFIDWILEYSVEDVNELSEKAQRLETWGKFESAEKLRAWVKLFNKCIEQEWDEEDSYRPIPIHPPYIFEGDFDLDMNGWYHSWELPEGYEPQDTYYEE